MHIGIYSNAFSFRVDAPKNPLSAIACYISIGMQAISCTWQLCHTFHMRETEQYNNTASQMAASIDIPYLPRYSLKTDDFRRQTTKSLRN